MASIQTTAQPSVLYRQLPWLAERTLRHEPAERLRRSIRNNKANVLMNGFFAVVNVATGKALFLVMMAPAIAHAAHKAHKLQKDPAPFHEKDRSLREHFDTYRAQVASGAWTGLPPIPVRVLVAPLAGLVATVVLWLVGHPAVAVSVSAGLAVGVLWVVAALLSVVLGLGTTDLDLLAP